MRFAAAGKTFDIRIHALAMQTPKPETWIETIQRQAARPRGLSEDWEQHCAWWADFWDRSWIIASDRTLPPEAREKFSGEAVAGGLREEKDGAALAAQSYNVFRFLMACQSRGRVQTKFNGGLFTQQLRVKAARTKRPAVRREQPDGTLAHARGRPALGPPLHLPEPAAALLAAAGQRRLRPDETVLRLLLQPAADAQGDHEGLVRTRRRLLPREHRTDRRRTRLRSTAAVRPRPSRARNMKAGITTTTSPAAWRRLAMMLDYVNYTGDAAFRDRVLVPFAREVLLFFDQHYPRGADGKLRLDPAQVLETWWIAVNPAPDVAGLRFCLDELLAMQAGTAEDQARWRRFRGEIPDVPSADHRRAARPLRPPRNGRSSTTAENGELYPVFPFRCFGLALGYRRPCGLDDAASHLQGRLRLRLLDAGSNPLGLCRQRGRGRRRPGRAASASPRPMCRFPLYGREGPDSCPDFDHFGAGSVALQRMLVQEAGGKILLLPAWPADWDADFKLHLAAHGAARTVKDGKLTAWDIQPTSRRNDVVVCHNRARAGIRK